MAHSLQTDMLGLLDRTPRSSKPHAPSRQQGEAFRKALDTPDTEQSGQKDTAADQSAESSGMNFLVTATQSNQAEAAATPTEAETAAEGEIKTGTGQQAEGEARAEATIEGANTPDPTLLSADAKASARETMTHTAKVPDADAVTPAAESVPAAKRTLEGATPAPRKSTAQTDSPDTDKAAKNAVRTDASDARTVRAAATEANPAATETKAPASEAAGATQNKVRKPAPDRTGQQDMDTTAVAAAGQVPVAPSAASSSDGKPSTQTATPVTTGAETPRRPDRSETPSDRAKAEPPHPADAAKTSSPDRLFAESADDINPPRSAEPGSKAEPIFSSASSAQATSSAPVQTAQQQTALQGMRAHAPMLAAPADIVDIVQQKLANDKGGDRVTVQLDPPELGRVSIDFKFDANGLQHVTITGDTPEALKQLRQVHFQLTQALEQNGLSGQDMTFRQNTSQQGQSQLGGQPSGTLLTGDEDAVMQVIPAAMQPARTISSGAGLDIKL